jgi:hypothetical protein
MPTIHRYRWCDPIDVFDLATTPHPKLYHEERIIYGTGEVVQIDEMSGQIAPLPARLQVAFIHVRSATNNCYQRQVRRV